MAQKGVDSSMLSCADRGDILNDNITKTKSLEETEDPLVTELEGETIAECPVCLQTCIHPVRLPCKHIFCFLCVKGAANQSKRCALCRQEIPVDYLNNPALLRKEDLLKENHSEDGFSWFYEGRNGWWQYDERTSHELEDRHKRDIKVFDLLIAGFLYVIDLDSMLQVRRNDPTRRRKIKRDLKDIPKKGVAGLKIAENAPPRHGADGIESGAQDDRDSRNANTVIRRNTSASMTNSNSVMNVNNPVVSASSTPLGSGQSSPQAPHNTPQSPSSEANQHQSSSPSQQDLSARMAHMSMDPVRPQRPERRGPQVGIPQPGSPTSSSDSDWD